MQLLYDRLYSGCDEGAISSDIGPAERSGRLCDHLERPRRQRGERRCERRAAVGGRIGLRTALARKHHGDEHVEPLHADASIPGVLEYCQV
jgi:hypothetical protein